MKFCYEMMLQHGRAFSVKFGPGSALFLCHPDTIRHAIKNTEAKPLNGFWNKGYSVVVPWIGELATCHLLSVTQSHHSRGFIFFSLHIRF